MTTKTDILDCAREVLRRGDSLTMDSVASEVDLTKAGVVHHFGSKEVLMLAVLDHLLDRWEGELNARAGDGAGPRERLRAYVEYTLLSDMDTSDLALLADPKLFDTLSNRWSERMDGWFGKMQDPRLVTARLVADGAWIDRCLDLLHVEEADRIATVELVNSLISEGDEG